jgi:hypothetical protein
MALTDHSRSDFSHLALINAVLHVIRAHEERAGGCFGRVWDVSM